MKKYILASLGAVLCFSGFVLYFANLQTTTAQQSSKIRWDYAVVNAIYGFNPERDKVNSIHGMVEICYLNSKGCSRSEVTHQFDYGEFLQERALTENYESRRQATLKASEIAFQKALAQLGSQGWEMISDPVLAYEFISVDQYNKYSDKSQLFTRSDTKAVYFKRLRQ